MGRMSDRALDELSDPDPAPPDPEVRCDRCGKVWPFGDGRTWQCLECGHVFCGDCCRPAGKRALVCASCVKGGES
jgi:hypothetical protein